jgi:hypothetical protein
MKENKKVVVIYDNDDWNRKIPMKRALTRKSFQDWHERGLKIGVEMYRACFGWYDYKKNVFRKSWAYRNGRWIKISKPVRPDIVYDKLSNRHDFKFFEKKIGMLSQTKILNNPLFRIAVGNKLFQYLILGEFMAKSYLACDSIELKKALKKIKSSKVVLKPLYGSGGFGIIIDKKSKIKGRHLNYPLLIQEFVKSRHGIPGFSKKKELADLRMIFSGQKLIYALSRIAKPGSHFTNLHQGASAVFVPEKRIPIETKKIARKIIKKLSIFPKIHCALDFMFTDSGKPVLIEMNNMPGFDLLYKVGNERIKSKSFKEFIKLLS